MKKLLATLLIAMLVSNVAMADTSNCDWSQIKQISSGDFVYNPVLNICVGNLVQDALIKDKQIQDLNQAVQLKDLALAKSDQRTQLWQQQADAAQDRLSRLDADAKRNDWLMFGLGALTVIGAGWMASRLIGH